MITDQQFDAIRAAYKISHDAGRPHEVCLREALEAGERFCMPASETARIVADFVEHFGIQHEQMKWEVVRYVDFHDRDSCFVAHKGDVIFHNDPNHDVDGEIERYGKVVAFANAAPAILAELNARPPSHAALLAEVEIWRGLVGKLVNARALSNVRELVAGWNGENLPEDKRHYERHPSRLGARIETNCGRIYELDEIMQEARAALEQSQS